MEAMFPCLGFCQPIAPDQALAQRQPALAPRVSDLGAGEFLFVAGSAAAQPFHVLGGAIMISRGLPDGRRQIIDIAGPGRIIGLVAGRRHDCSALALQPAQVIALDSAPPADALLAEIHRLRDLATLLGRKTAIEKLASFLLDMMREDFIEGARLDFPVTRQEIADYLGLALETVCRNFVALKKRGLIAPASRESIFVLDIAGLRRLASCVETGRRRD